MTLFLPKRIVSRLVVRSACIKITHTYAYRNQNIHQFRPIICLYTTFHETLTHQLLSENQIYSYSLQTYHYIIFLKFEYDITEEISND